MDKKTAVYLAVNVTATIVTSVAATAAHTFVIEKMKQRRARKEAAANLCLND
jgi:hypothetical protein